MQINLMLNMEKRTKSQPIVKPINNCQYNAVAVK
jgi:hypothetical protein